MSVDLDLSEDRLEFTVRIDHEGAALNAPMLLPVHVFLFVDPIGLGDVCIFIAEQWKMQPELLDELQVRLLPVQTDTEDDTTGPEDLGFYVTKVAGLLRATWRVVFRIEVRHDLLPLEAFQCDGLAVLIRKPKLRCLVPNRDVLRHT